MLQFIKFLVQKVVTEDALLHAIKEEYVEAVEVLLDHEESIHKEEELWVKITIKTFAFKLFVWFLEMGSIDGDVANFTPDISPLILAAHTDNYEVIKILLDIGAVLPCPHHQR